MIRQIMLRTIRLLIHYVDETKPTHEGERCRNVVKSKCKHHNNSTNSQTNEQGVKSILSANRFRYLIEDDFSDCEKAVENNVNVNHVYQEENIS